MSAVMSNVDSYGRKQRYNNHGTYARRPTDLHRSTAGPTGAAPNTDHACVTDASRTCSDLKPTDSSSTRLNRSRFSFAT